jgi:hypothetical protein
VKKKNDHLTAAKMGEVNYFITTEGNFRKIGAKGLVKMLAPQEFANLVGIEAYETSHG